MKGVEGGGGEVVEEEDRRGGGVGGGGRLRKTHLLEFAPRTVIDRQTGGKKRDWLVSLVVTWERE